VQAGVNLGKGWRSEEARTDRVRGLLFGQDSAVIYEAAKALED
jgi:hypothetical protein